MKKLSKIFGGLFSETEPTLNKGQIIQPKKEFKASYSNLSHIDFKGEYVPGEECTIKKDMRLKFHSEDDFCLFFIVRCNYLLKHSKKEVHAQDKAIIYIFKTDFNIKDFVV